LAAKLEGEQMTVVTPDTLPLDILRRFRGKIFEAVPAYPEVLHLKVKDTGGGEWWFGTHEAEWSPSDPDALLGKTVIGAEFETGSGRLTIGFSDDSTFTVTSKHEGSPDDLEAWELFTPEGLVLAFGPNGQWQLGRGDETPADLLLRPPASELGPVRDSRQWKQACREMKLDEDERELASRDLHAFQSAEEAGR
jgi:hypothetical protein